MLERLVVPSEWYIGDEWDGVLGRSDPRRWRNGPQLRQRRARRGEGKSPFQIRRGSNPTRREQVNDITTTDSGMPRNFGLED